MKHDFKKGDKVRLKAEYRHTDGSAKHHAMGVHGCTCSLTPDDPVEFTVTSIDSEGDLEGEYEDEDVIVPWQAYERVPFVLDPDDAGLMLDPNAKDGFRLPPHADPQQRVWHVVNTELLGKWLAKNWLP